MAALEAVPREIGRRPAQSKGNSLHVEERDELIDGAGSEHFAIIGS